MIKDFVFQREDCSFDCGDRTYYDYCEHGFSIDIDENNFVDIETLEGYGDFEEMNGKIKTLPQLEWYILNHSYDDDYQEEIDELLLQIEDSIRKRIKEVEELISLDTKLCRTHTNEWLKELKELKEVIK